MATLLRRLRVKRVDLVDKGANFDPATGEGAHVLLFKSQPTSSEVNVPGIEPDKDEMVCKACGAKVAKDAAKCQKCGAPMVSKADDRPKEDAVDEKIKAELADATAKLSAATSEIEKLKGANEALQKQLDTPEAIEKRKLEALPTSVRERIEKQDAAIKKLEDEKSEREMIEVVKSAMPQLPGKFEDSGKLLKRAKEALTAEDFEALTVVLKAASAQIEKGGLFREVGKRGDGAPAADPMTQINALADAMVTKDAKLNRDAAIDLVLHQHPDLYEAYSRSVTVGHKAASAADAN